jgi:hypothetical protein
VVGLLVARPFGGAARGPRPHLSEFSRRSPSSRCWQPWRPCWCPASAGVAVLRVGVAGSRPGPACGVHCLAPASLVGGALELWRLGLFYWLLPLSRVSRGLLFAGLCGLPSGSGSGFSFCFPLFLLFPSHAFVRASRAFVRASHAFVRTPGRVCQPPCWGRLWAVLGLWLAACRQFAHALRWR